MVCVCVCVYFLLIFHCVLGKKKKNLLKAKHQVKRDLKSQGAFMKNESVCINSVYVHVGILQETNFDVFKSVMPLLCLYNLSLQDFKEIVAFNILLFGNG